MNILSEIIVIFSDSLTDCKLTQLAKALPNKEVTLFGITKLTNPESEKDKLLI
jgi:hypothetical protein